MTHDLMYTALHIGYKNPSLLQCTLNSVPTGEVVRHCTVEGDQYIAGDLKATALSNLRT